jgi:hypothetical protein
MDEQTKKTYIETINKFGIDDTFKQALVSFVESYDGKNTVELELLLIGLSQHLLKVEEIKIKADAFDKISAIKKARDERLSDINEAAEIIKDENRVPLIPVGLSEDLKPEES